LILQQWRSPLLLLTPAVYESHCATRAPISPAFVQLTAAAMQLAAANAVDHHRSLKHLAEVVGGYVQQGTRLYVHGRLNTESWEDRNSRERRYRISIVAEKLLVLGNGRQPASSD
jgi:Single-strand binding protein family